MNYQTFDPRDELSALVKCYWTLDSPAEIHPQKQKIVPDGCMEMIFHYGDLYRQYHNENESIIQPRSFVFGQITTPLEIEPIGVTGIFSVRFHPDGFLPVAPIPVKQMENRAVSLFELYGSAGVKLEKEILSATTTEAKIKIIESFLLEKLLQNDTIDRIVKSTVTAMLDINGQLKVNELSQQLEINRKQLERKFSTVIGLSPKQLSKIIRMQTALRSMLDKDFESLTAAAYEGNYYDQAHFIKDFKEFTGMTPKQFYGADFKLSAIFYG